MLSYIEPTDDKDLNKFKLFENQLVSAGDSLLRIRKRIRIIKDNDSKRRGYLYQCEKCNYIGIRREDQLIKGNNGCPVCTGKKCKWNNEYFY